MSVGDDVMLVVTLCVILTINGAHSIVDTNRFSVLVDVFSRTLILIDNNEENDGDVQRIIDNSGYHLVSLIKSLAEYKCSKCS